jgi:N4-gp56 family major capsid protein
MAFDSYLQTGNGVPGSSAGGANLFSNIVQEAIFTAQERAVLPQTTTIYDIGAVAGKTAQIPVYPTVSAAALTEGTDIDTDANVNPTGVVITASEYGVLANLTDAMRDSAGRNVAADVGRILGESIAKAQDTQIATNFANFSQTVGSTSTTATIELIFAAAATLRESNAPAPYFCVVSPKQAFQLKKSLVSAGYSTGANAISDAGNEALRSGIVGTIAGVTIIESNSLAAGPGATGKVGAVYSAAALGVAIKKGITIETQRDASARATEIVATAMWGSGELVDAYGVRFTALDAI